MSKAQLVITAVVLEGAAKVRSPATTTSAATGSSSWYTATEPREPRRSSRAPGDPTATPTPCRRRLKTASCGGAKP
jgi:hypothetical protein